MNGISSGLDVDRMGQVLQPEVSGEVKSKETLAGKKELKSEVAPGEKLAVSGDLHEEYQKKAESQKSDQPLPQLQGPAPKGAAPKKEGGVEEPPKPVVKSPILDELQQELEATTSMEDLQAIVDIFAQEKPVIDESIFGKIYSFAMKAPKEGKKSIFTEPAMVMSFKSLLPTLSNEKLQLLTDFVDSDQYKQMQTYLVSYINDLQHNVGLESYDPLRYRYYSEVHKVQVFVNRFKELVVATIKDRPEITRNDMYLVINGKNPEQPKKMDPQIIKTILEPCMENAKSRLASGVEKDINLARHSACYELTKDTPDLKQLKTAVDSYFKNNKDASVVRSVIDISYDDIKRIPKDKWAAVKANVQKILQSDEFGKDPAVKLFISHIAARINALENREVEEGATKQLIDGNLAAFKKTELGWSLWHWLKNLFTFGPTYSLTEENFRDSVRAFAKSISFDNHQLLDSKFQAKPISERVLPGYIENAIKDANPDISVADLKKYSQWAVQIFNEEQANWQKDNEYTKGLTKAERLEDQEYPRDTLDGAVNNFVKAVLHKAPLEELAVALGDLSRNYRGGDDLYALGDVLNRLPYNTRRKFAYQIANISELKKNVELLAYAADLKNGNSKLTSMMRTFANMLEKTFSDSYFVSQELAKLDYSGVATLSHEQADQLMSLMYPEEKA